MSYYQFKNLFLSMGVLLSAMSAYACNECCECHQGYPLECNERPMAYNTPASIDVRCPYHVIASGSYILWKPIEEGTDVAGVEKTNGRPSVVKMDPDYQSGFKVGLGYHFDCDSWILYSEYTRLHFSKRVTKEAGAGEDLISTFGAVVASPSSFVSTDWKVGLDMLDLQLSRPYYVGKKVVFKPFAGIRALWLDQKISSDIAVINPQSSKSTNISADSWALGPRIGVEMQWLLDYGLRFFSKGGAALFVQHFRTKFAALPSSTEASSSEVNRIIPNGDLGLGMGWGTYFNDCKFHIDLSLAYELQFFAQQNRMRHAKDLTIAQAPSRITPVDGEYGSLTFHGFTFTLAMDF